ncbi:MAG: hypothetical protein P8Y64_09375 [Gammaproteobacteria bacterium]|jgi:cytochrome c
MKIRLSLLLALLGSVLLGSLVTQVHAQTTERYAMGPGMMGGGMGQSSASGSTGSSSNEPPALNQGNAQKLVGYIQAQGLRCMQCHSVADGGFGPNFLSIAAFYKGNADAEKIIQARIVGGIGRMPGGFSSPRQAGKLASLIVELVDQPEQ